MSRDVEFFHGLHFLLQQLNFVFVITNDLPHEAVDVDRLGGVADAHKFEEIIAPRDQLAQDAGLLRQQFVNKLVNALFVFLEDLQVLLENCKDVISLATLQYFLIRKLTLASVNLAFVVFSNLDNSFHIRSNSLD